MGAICNLQLVRCSIGWPETDRHPTVAIHSLSNHGPIQTLKAEVKALYTQHQIDRSTPEACVPAVAEELKGAHFSSFFLCV